MPPMSMDPRIGCDEESSHILNMVFEGLTQIDTSGKPSKALAKDILISDNKRVYTFTLKKTKWSNGQDVTAYDFEYAWKSVIFAQLSTARIRIFLTQSRTPKR